MTKEIERSGLPIVQVTNLVNIAEGIGVHRVLKGNSVLHVFGNPKLPKESEKEYRVEMVEKALELLTEEPEEGQYTVVKE